MGSKLGVDGTVDVTVSGYSSPDGRNVGVQSNMGALFSDGFGPVLDMTKWDIFDGGLPANPTLRGKTLTQAAIGSGVAMGAVQALTNGTLNTALSMTATASALTVTVPVTNSAELWLLSQQIFAGSEDIMAVVQKSAALAATSIFIGLVEVDPNTLIPIYNANTPTYTQTNACPFYFTNAGGVELGMTATATAFASVAIEDGSTAAQLGSVGTAIASIVSTPSEFLGEFHAEDVIWSNGTVDSVAAKGATPSRVSTQVPNDGKVYKLLMRFRNVTASAGQTVTISRICLVDGQEMRVEVSSGRGDSNGQKAVAVNVANAPTLGTGTATIGGVIPKLTTFGGLSVLKINTGFNGLIKATGGHIYSYDLLNNQASPRYFHLYPSATTVAAGGSTQTITIGIPANGKASLSTDIGWAVTTGMAWGVTTDAAGATQGASGDVVGTLGYA